MLKMLAPDTFKNYKWFGMRFCDGKILNIRGNQIMDFKGASNTDELNQLASAFMIRRLKKDVLQDLPEKQRIIIPVEVDLKKYQKIEMEAMLNLDALPAIQKCKQVASDSKLKTAIDWIRDYLENGRKLVVFAHYVATLDALEKAFPGCARIDGSVPSNNRAAIVDRFQNDENYRLFIGNLEAAGVGLTLTTASATLTLELGWVPGDHLQAEDRVHRIGQEAGSVEAYYMIAKKTIDEPIMGTLDKKMKDVTAIVDGKAIESEELMRVLMQKYGKDEATQKPQKKEVSPKPKKTVRPGMRI